MMNCSRIRKSFDGDGRTAESGIKGVVLAAAVLLLTAVLLCGAVAADGDEKEILEYPTGYIEPVITEFVYSETDLIADPSHADYDRETRLSGKSKYSASAGKYTSLQKAPVSHPPKFDLRNYYLVTSVKDQGQYGTCWAFAAIASVESSAILYGYETASSADFSEAQLAYFTYNRNGVTVGTVPPRFTRLSGDNVIVTPGKKYYNIGGNPFFAAHTMMAGIGTAPESSVPYSQIASPISAEKAYADNKYLVASTDWIPFSDRELVKDFLMNVGCGVLSYYAVPGTECGPNPDGSYSIYNPTEVNSNHAVTLVGWDDAYPITNFDPAHRPSSPGAWLIKNSWGTVNRGQDGYYWISYEDKSLTEAAFYEVFPSEYFDTIYQYDGGIASASSYDCAELFYDNKNKVYFASVENCYYADADQWIVAISYELLTPDVTADITIFNSTESPIYEGWICPNTAGYYMYILPEPVYVSAGEILEVVLDLESSSDFSVMGDVCDSTTDVTFVSQNQDCESYYYDYIDEMWYYWDAECGFNYRIKAYGVNANQPDKSLSLTSGWNFISISEPLEDNSAESVFKVVDCAAHSPLRYNSSSGEWELVKKTDSISPLEGYYVYSDSADTISVGKPIPRVYYARTVDPYEKTITPGWNTVSLGSSVPFSAEMYLSGVPSWTEIVYDGATYEHGTAISPANDKLLPADTPMWLYADSTGSIQEVW